MQKDKTMKCADCLHYEACQSWIRHGTALWDDFHYSVEDCPFYEYKSEWVHLPCKVGDLVYYPWIYDGIDGIASSEVVSIKIYVNRLPLVFIRDFESDMPMPTAFYTEDFGEIIFLTREEAEIALAERKEK